MKSDLLTAIIAAIAGTVISYFVCGLLIGPIDSVNVTTIETAVDANVDDPNPEVFNYRAINPTVEVYVGNCDGQYNDLGECIENSNNSGSNSDSENTDSNGEDTNNEDTP